VHYDDTNNKYIIIIFSCARYVISFFHYVGVVPSGLHLYVASMFEAALAFFFDPYHDL
jgi:Uri superfamily endonuclease